MVLDEKQILKFENERFWNQKGYERDITKRLRVSFCHAIKYEYKNGFIIRLLDMPIQEFKLYLESKWDHKATWYNWGYYWQIDHIIPVSAFCSSRLAELRVCWHWSNFQPLLAKDNRAKGKKIVE